MALTNTTQFANRYGLNIKIYDYELDEQGAVVEPTGTPKMLIDFANVCDVDISGDRVWATGGQAHANKIAFNDPIQGTFTISTQILTTQLLALMSGGDIPIGTEAEDEIVFQNTVNSMYQTPSTNTAER